MTKKDFTKKELEQPVTLGLLLEFTDQHLIPTLDNLIRERIKNRPTKKEVAEMIEKKLDKKMTSFPTKEYLDDKLADFTADIFERLERKNFFPDKKYKKKVNKVLSRNKLITSTEFKELETLAK